MRVFCSVEHGDLENEEGRLVAGVTVTCSRCDHEAESFGTGDNSVRRCCALLREECPLDEENYYFTEPD